MAQGLPATEWLARTVARSGTRHVFFVDAILRNSLIALAEQGVSTVLAHSEKAAAYMADGYARVSGRPGICMAQSVGSANLASGLQDPWLGQSPVIAITGRKVDAHQHRNAYQEVDHARLFEAVAKLSARVSTPSDLPRLFRQAWRTALAGNPRPVHLDLAGPFGEIIELGEVDETIDDPIFSASVPPYRPVPSQSELRLAADAIRRAQRPLLVSGAGAIASRAHAEVLQLAERLHAPIATTLGGRGIVPTRHRLAIGTVGTYGVPPTNELVHAADLAIVIGSQLSDQSTVSWQVPARGKPVVQIDIDPLEHGRSYAGTLGLQGDPKATITALLAELDRAGGNAAPSIAFADQAADSMGKWRRAIAPACRSGATPIRVERLCATLGELLPSKAILVADTGYSGIWTCTLIELDGVSHTYLRAAGSLGWAFPAALGAKCAAPSRKVICFTGDGGFYYHLAELETARRRGLAVTVIVNNNSGFGQGYVNMRRQGKTPEQLRELACFTSTNFAEVARAFGVEGVRVERPDDLDSVLSRAIAADRTVVVDIATDIAAATPQAWNPNP
ncbi:MAG TPA: thiamine pyrophosphate-binding protein [Casimicrobiaceae bacterium]|nr:thiamine pyrophosphate-binding protein [Casimicrobiaceae bacterium]